MTQTDELSITALNRNNTSNKRFYGNRSWCFLAICVDVLQIADKKHLKGLEKDGTSRRMRCEVFKLVRSHIPFATCCIYDDDNYGTTVFRMKPKKKMSAKLSENMQSLVCIICKLTSLR